jgi:RP/EB family microtubule-associated protein
MSEVIGMMEGAFFVSRGELLLWINKTFSLNLTKIEQLGTGAVYCQILDAIFPGKVNMTRVNFKAKLEWEFVNNFKVLQQSFLKCNLNKHIEVEKLVKAKYQDNLEFAQWMKRYYDLNGGGSKEYDAIMRRGGVEADFGFADKIPTKEGRHEKIAVNLSPPEKEKSIVLKSNKNKDKDMRSYSPSLRNLNKENIKSNLLRDKLVNLRQEKDFDDDVKILQKQLNEIKLLSLEADSAVVQEKLKKILEVSSQALTSKLFAKDRFKAKPKQERERPGMKDDSIEDTKENY